MVDREPEAVMSKILYRRKLGVGLCCLQIWRSSAFNRCCAKRYLLSFQPGLYVCLPGSLSGALVNLEVVIRSVVYDEDRFFRFVFSVISDKNNKGHRSQT